MLFMDEEALKEFIRQQSVETRQHFDVVAEGLKHEIRIVADGVLGNTARLDRVDVRLDGIDVRLDGIDVRFDGIEVRLDGFDRRFDTLEAELHRESDEIRSMIRLSYAELDRRLRALEDTVTELQSRMDRVESRILR